MEFIDCLLCGNKEEKPFLYGKDINFSASRTFQLVKCGNCGLVYMNPRINAADGYDLYAADYYIDLKGCLKYFVKLLNLIFYKIRVSRIKRFKDRGTILDVGCGTGEFLTQIQKQGWQCYGLEPSSAACKIINDDLRFNILKQPLCACEFADAYFDIITFWHSLEHIADPVSALKKIHKMIKKDGLLFIAVPNIDSLEFKISKKRWFHLDLPHHLYYYSPKSLNTLLEHCGFEVLNINHYAFEYNIFSFSQSLINIVDTNFNAFYRFLKHGRLNKAKYYTLTELYSIALGILLNIILFIPSLSCTYFAAIFKQSAVIYAYARKK